MTTPTTRHNREIAAPNPAASLSTEHRVPSSEVPLAGSPVSAGRTATSESSFYIRAVTAALAVMLVLLSQLVVAQTNSPIREEVRSFDSAITIRKNATLLVQEKITVRALGVQIQHGIYREFVPQDGHPAPAVEMVNAQLDGQPVPYEVKEENGARRIYLGDPDTPLVTGDHEFLITYETPAVVADENGRDRLYWNVTGNSWDFPITDVTAHVALPGGVPQDTVTVAGYTGAYGATGKDYMFDLDTPGTVTFTAGPLPHHQGLTISVEFPRGHIRHGWNIPLLLLDHAGLAAALVGMFVLLLYWAVSWFYFGKDPAPGPIMARTTPPQEVSPAGMRYLTQMALDNKAFTTAVVSLARSGVLSIEEGPDDYILTRTHADYHELPMEERVLAKALFGGGHTVSLKMNARRVRKALDAFRKALQERYSNHFATHARFTPPALAITAVAVFASLYLELGPRLKDDGPTALTVLLCGVACGLLLHRIWPHSLREWRRPARTQHAAGGVSPERRNFFVALALGVVLVVLWAALGESVSWVWATMLLLYAGLNIGFAFVMKAPTPQGRRVLDDIAGFRIHLRRLSAAMAAATEDDEQAIATFESYLAYAMALDMENEWGRRFQAALQQDVESAARYIPHWYRGENFDRFILRPAFFGVTAATAATAAYSHASAGGGIGGGTSGPGGGTAGGGGFSGGGAGAGGGGGW